MERSNSSCPIWKITRIREVGDNLELSLIDDIGVEAEAPAPEACLTWGWGTDQVPDGLNVFQYAYAITCHKAQGSEFGYVIVVGETRSPAFAKMERRWTYTVLSRAVNRVDYVMPPG